MESVPLGCCDYMGHNEASMDALPNLNLWETESFDSVSVNNNIQGLDQRESWVEELNRFCHLL